MPTISIGSSSWLLWLIVIRIEINGKQFAPAVKLSRKLSPDQEQRYGGGRARNYSFREGLS